MWHSQNLIAANNDYDVVNLFYGFLSGSSNRETFDGKPVRSQLQKRNTPFSVLNGTSSKT